MKYSNSKIRHLGNERDKADNKLKQIAVNKIISNKFRCFSRIY